MQSSSAGAAGAAAAGGGGGFGRAIIKIKERGDAMQRTLRLCAANSFGLVCGSAACSTEKRCRFQTGKKSFESFLVFYKKNQTQNEKQSVPATAIRAESSTIPHPPHARRCKRTLVLAQSSCLSLCLFTCRRPHCTSR